MSIPEIYYQLFSSSFIYTKAFYHSLTITDSLASGYKKKPKILMKI